MLIVTVAPIYEVMYKSIYNILSMFRYTQVSYIYLHPFLRAIGTIIIKDSKSKLSYVNIKICIIIYLMSYNGNKHTSTEKCA